MDGQVGGLETVNDEALGGKEVQGERVRWGLAFRGVSETVKVDLEEGVRFT